MSGLSSWWAQMWPQVFPNLLASLLWVPCGALGLWVYHHIVQRLVAHHAARMEAKLDEATAKLHEASRKIEKMLEEIGARG